MCFELCTIWVAYLNLMPSCHVWAWNVKVSFDQCRHCVLNPYYTHICYNGCAGVPLGIVQIIFWDEQRIKHSGNGETKSPRKQKQQLYPFSMEGIPKARSLETECWLGCFMKPLGLFRYLSLCLTIISPCNIFSTQEAAISWSLTFSFLVIYVTLGVQSWLNDQLLYSSKILHSVTLKWLYCFIHCILP